MSDRPEDRTRSGDEHLEMVAAGVVDGREVDWEAEVRRTPNLGGTLDGLHRIQQIAQAFRDADANTAEGSSDPEPALFTWGPFRVLEKLGDGSFGEVYRAFEPRLEREVALKLRRVAEADSPDPGSRLDRDASPGRRALDEARRLARVRHPHVLAVHGADLHDQHLGIWTDLVLGSSLEERLAQQGPLSADEAVLIGLDLCRALAAVHLAGLIHGDLKAANVMREAGGRIVLIDFGSARWRGQPGLPLSATPFSLPPECLSGGEAGPEADLYALGILLFRLTTGRYPLQAETLEELRRAHAQGPRCSLRELRPDCSTAFVQVVEGAIAADPSQRFATAGEFEAALLAAVSMESRVKRVARPAALAVAAVAVLALALTLGTQRFHPGALPTGTFTPPPRTGTDTRSVVPSVSLSLLAIRDGVPKALNNGDGVRLGDRLRLEIQADRSLHAYVLNEDEKGALFVLFPLAGFEPVNPLAGAMRHRLPGRAHGSPQDWVVTSAGGREAILVVCSEQPLSDLEEAVAALPAARPDSSPRYAELSPVLLDDLRGIGATSASRDRVGLVSAARPGERLRELERRITRLSQPGVFTHLLQIESDPE